MVKIRLARHGAKKRPYYRIVAADSRCPRDGKFIEEVGRYNPCSSPKVIQFDTDAIDKWLSQGAQMTDVVASLYENYKKDNK
ncbi:30S ribosomal protein S16 [Phoenicibacter congonensis]|uniref:30S ribosomal protein S16 n=1 Tax=Phoenicibacter congonensis TaxID=1944646 RepID=UPI0009A8B2DB|nr:30S ribosomal protein S16 [Phoenicibacter congonensis]